MPEDQQTQGAAGPAAAMPQSQDQVPQVSMSPSSIYTMPDKFMAGGAQSRFSASVSGSATGGGSGKRMIVIIGVLTLFLGGITAGAYFYLNSGGDLFGLLGPASAPEQPNANQAPVPPSNQATTTPTNQPSPQDEQAMLARDVQRGKDIDAISQALYDYYTKFNAYPPLLDAIPKDMLAIVPKDPSSGSPYEYASADKRLSYTLGLVVEKELVLGGQTHPAGHLTFQPKTTPTATSTPPITEPPPAPPAPGPDLSNLDSDSDGLTASEEVLFQTSPVNPDSDSDGYRDNIEIMNFYSPTDSTGIKLDQAGLVKLSTNQAQNFNFYYPTSWVVSVPDADGKETLITTGTGENFSISVKDNPDSKTSWEWYTQNISHDYNPSSVTIVNIAGHEAIKTLDGLQAYVAAGTKIYVLKYTLNTETVIRYPSVFTFILNYFKIL